MAAKFEISKDHAGKFRFHLKAPNGDHCRQRGLRVKGQCRERDRGDQNPCAQRQGRRPQLGEICSIF
jgi:hypothetical protein